MKFKKLKRLFSSSKKVESDNSPANSPSETDKKKPRPNPKEETRRPNRIFGFVAVLKEFTKKHCKRASSDQVSLRSYLSFSCSNGRKLRAETSNLASSLGSNRIKSRSLRVTLATCFSFRKDKATPVVRSHDLPELITRQDSGTSCDDHICSKLSCSCCCYVVTCAHLVEMLSYATVNISVIVFSLFLF